MTTPSDPAQQGQGDAAGEAESPSQDSPAAETSAATEAEQTTASPEEKAPSNRLPARRPPEVWAGAVFLTLAAVPALFLGVLLAVQPGRTGSNLQDTLTGARASMDLGTLLALFRVAGLLLLVLGAIYIVLAWIATKPNRGARTIVTIMAAVEVALLVFAMVVSGTDPVSLGLLLLAVAGALLLYLPRSEEFFGQSAPAKAREPEPEPENATS
ncbi:hypothetical protein GCM10023321_28840 [Pseudonocardia eucalypti]|uniref:Uncharacterized protein n=1 Tax=Pseudonocardia eucalypti TaxID=648755 RepID=A0ABP9Q179_9PSEU|nr:hypothetical protein [Pseudonocardia eucalypti]